MHKQLVVQTRGVGAEPNCETGDIVLFSRNGRGRVLRSTVGEQHTQSFIDAVESWLAAREVMQVEQLANRLGT